MGSTPLQLADRYRLYEQIGSGCVTTVWLAWDQLLARLVAVKVVRPSMVGDPAFRARFLEQAGEAARLSHPAIVAVHDFGQSRIPDGETFPFVVMELLEGEVLSTRLCRGPLPVPEAIRICGQVAMALAHAHAAGVAHHDLKPGNVFLTPAGVKILDFATAKALGDAGEHAGAEDVRALGRLLVATLTGRWDEEIVLPPEMPYEVAAVYLQCMLPDPAERPSSAQVAEALISTSEGRPTLMADAPAERTRGVRRSRARRHLAVVLSAVAVVVIIALTFRGGPPEHVVTPPAVYETGLPTSISSTPSPAPSPSPSRTTPTVPSVRPSSRGPTQRAEPSPERTPTATPKPQAPPAPIEVLSRAQRSVDEGVAAGEIRSDVGVDLNNVLGNLRRELESGQQVDLKARVAEIRNKISTRLGENGLTPQRAAKLDAILREIA